MAETSDIEATLWRKFERITGSNVQDRGLGDVLHVLTGPELLPHLLDYLCSLELNPKEDVITYYAIERIKSPLEQ